MVKCEKCGKIIREINIRRFEKDGSDRLCVVPIIEVPENAVVLDTDFNWCGYDLTPEEQREDIECPYCRQFPFKYEEIQTEEVLRLIMFKTVK